MPNAFETGARKMIPAVLVYIQKDDRFLMLHRNAKEGDHHAGRYNGLGGKCEPDESPQEAAAREVAEESGLKLNSKAFRPLGVLHFPNFKAHKAEDWLVHVLTANAPKDQEPWERGPEGDLHWIARDRLLELNLWPGDREFLPLVIAGRPFLGTLWYAGAEVKRAEIQGL